jgi:hypothetical protein
MKKLHVGTPVRLFETPKKIGTESTEHTESFFSTDFAFVTPTKQNDLCEKVSEEQSSIDKNTLEQDKFLQIKSSICEVEKYTGCSLLSQLMFETPNGRHIIGPTEAEATTTDNVPSSRLHSHNTTRLIESKIFASALIRPAIQRPEPAGSSKKIMGHWDEDIAQFSWIGHLTDASDGSMNQDSSQLDLPRHACELYQSSICEESDLIRQTCIERCLQLKKCDGYVYAVHFKRSQRYFLCEKTNNEYLSGVYIPGLFVQVEADRGNYGRTLIASARLT